MTELSPLRGIDWMILFSVLFAFVLAGMSLRRDVDGRRISGLLVIPLASGVLLLAGILIGLFDQVLDIVELLDRPLTATLALLLALVAVAVADLLFTRLASLPARLWSRGSPRTRGDIGLALFVGGAVVLALGGVLVLEARVDADPVDSAVDQPAEALDSAWQVEAVTGLSGPPLGIALRSEREGYLSIGGDRIVHFELSSDGEPFRLDTVAEGFGYARGLAVAGDRLIVADLGPLPACPEAFPYCKGASIPDVDPADGERRIIEESDGRLVSYDIRPDGTLAGERTIVSGLPVVNTEHGVNGVAIGPKGGIYASIGNIDQMPPGELERVEHPRRNLLGTIIRVSPDGGNLQVFARGLRNVYGLTFDEDGGLWGVDNDGPTPNGWRAEEILRIRQGSHYGFPYDGSFNRPTIRDDWPVWHAEGVGAAGLSWGGDLGLGPGLLIGLCGHIDGLRLSRYHGEWRVETGSDYARLLDLPGCVSGIAPVRDGRFLASVFDAEALYLVRVTPEE